MAGRATQPQITKVQQELTFEETNQIFKKAQKAMGAATTKVEKKQLTVNELELEIEDSHQLIRRVQNRLDLLIQAVGNFEVACARAKLDFQDFTMLKLHAETILKFEQAERKRISGEIEEI